MNTLSRADRVPGHTVAPVRAHLRRIRRYRPHVAGCLRYQIRAEEALDRLVEGDVIIDVTVIDLSPCHAMDGSEEDHSAVAADMGAAGAAPSRKRARAPQPPAALRPEELAAFAATERRKGVVYLSRIPPYMKPQKVRSLLEKHAEIGRVFLATEGVCVCVCVWEESDCVRERARVRASESECARL